MQQEEKWAAQVRRTLTECFDQVRFARAAELARSGRYLEAEALLCRRGELPRNPKDLDLLARIAAQQRQYDRAGDLWNRALATAPGEETFLQALEALQRVRIRKQVNRELQREFIKGFLFFLLLMAATVLALMLSSPLR